MKQSVKRITAALLCMTMAAAFVGCGDDSAPAASTPESKPAAESKNEEAPKEEAKEEAKDGNKTVGIAMPTKSLERWNRDGEYLKQQFEDAGYQVELKYSDNDTNQQNNDIQGMIADGVDLLLIVAIDGNALTQTLDDAKGV